MFERLQQLPLFQGLSFSELSEIVEWMKLDFCQFRSGDIVVSQGDKCNSIVFIIGGTVCAEYVDESMRFALAESLDAPMVLEPYSLFGMYQNYTRTYWMKTDGGGLVVKKNVFNELLRRYQVVRTNYMNMVCTRLQKSSLAMARMPQLSIRGKIAKVVTDVACSNKGCKLLRIKMEALAEIVGETRLNVSRELNKLRSEGAVSMKRGEVLFNEFSAMGV